jgi:hypothetical protein
MTGVDYSTAPQLAILLSGIVLYAAAAVFAAMFHRQNSAGCGYPICIIAAAVTAGRLAALLADTHSGFRLPLGLPIIGLHVSLMLVGLFQPHCESGAADDRDLAWDLTRRDLGRVEPLPACLGPTSSSSPEMPLASVFLGIDVAHFMGSRCLTTDAGNRHAGACLVVAAIGDLALFAFGGLAGASGNYAFDAIRAVPPGPLVSGLVLAGAIFGAGSKAGIAPLHAWLPLAHPAAPSHVSALMSGVMTKVAIYGLIRIVFDLLGTPVWWWALPFLLLGAATAVLGLLYAVLDHDLKRVLAYSTVEIIGIIFVGLGLALAFKASGLTAAAAVAMAATLFTALTTRGLSHCSFSVQGQCCMPRDGAISTGLAD